MKHDRTWARPMPWMVVGLVSLMPMSVGCQQWSLRESTAKWFGGTAEDDDWAPPTDVTYNLDERTAYEVEKRSSGDAAPKSKRIGAGWWAGNRNANSEPPPRVILPKEREAQKKAAEESAAQALAKSLKDQSNKVAADSSASASTTSAKTEPPKADAPKPDAAKPEAAQASVAKPEAPKGTPPSVEGTKPSVASTETAGAKSPAKPEVPGNAAPAAVDTGLAEVDVEGAINALPAQYRDVIRMRMSETDEAKPTTDTSKIAESAAKPSPTNSTPTPPGPSQPVAAAPAPSTTVVAPPAAAQVAIAPSVPPKSVTTAEFQADAQPAPTKPFTVRLGSDESDATSVVTTSHVESRAAMPAARLSWHQYTSLAIQELESQLAKDPPSDPELRHSQEMTLRMLYVTQRRLEDAMRPIASLTQEEQQFVQQEIKALYEASDPDANPARARHWSQVMLHHREANHALADMANLEVKQLAFCDEVSGYGIFSRCKTNLFAPDQDVLLYCEIDNVTAERIKDGYITQLQGSYEIYDAQKRKVTEQLLPMEPELCQNQRRDYYIVYRIFMPQQIQPGRHELVLNIEDMKGHKFGQAAAEFQIKR
ncbi:MAG: hypothetical protein ACK5OB_12200 [Pirellula sp.]